MRGFSRKDVVKVLVAGALFARHVSAGEDVDVEKVVMTQVQGNDLGVAPEAVVEEVQDVVPSSDVQETEHISEVEVTDQIVAGEDEDDEADVVEAIIMEDVDEENTTEPTEVVEDVQEEDGAEEVDVTQDISVTDEPEDEEAVPGDKEEPQITWTQFPLELPSDVDGVSCTLSRANNDVSFFVIQGSEMDHTSVEVMIKYTKMHKDGPGRNDFMNYLVSRPSVMASSEMRKLRRSWWCNSTFNHVHMKLSVGDDFRADVSSFFKYFETEDAGAEEVESVVQKMLSGEELTSTEFRIAAEHVFLGGEVIVFVCGNKISGDHLEFLSDKVGRFRNGRGQRTVSAEEVDAIDRYMEGKFGKETKVLCGYGCECSMVMKVECAKQDFVTKKLLRVVTAVLDKKLERPVLEKVGIAYFYVRNERFYGNFGTFGINFSLKTDITTEEDSKEVVKKFFSYLKTLEVSREEFDKVRESIRRRFDDDVGCFVRRVVYAVAEASYLHVPLEMCLSFFYDLEDVSYEEFCKVLERLADPREWNNVTLCVRVVNKLTDEDITAMQERIEERVVNPSVEVAAE